jgi:ABC-type antimicrobial peptide transport system permease subunit
VFARINGNSETAYRTLEQATAVAAPGAIDQFHTMGEILAVQLYPFRAVYWISAAVGALALLLTLSGIYGVLSFLVNQRTKEIGIRMALGARPGAVAGLILAQSLRFAGIGATIGAGGAFVAIRITASQVDLPVSAAADTGAFVGVLALVIAASAAAAWVPSRRAARIEPISTLRCD